MSVDILATGGTRLPWLLRREVLFANQESIEYIQSPKFHYYPSNQIEYKLKDHNSDEWAFLVAFTQIPRRDDRNQCIRSDIACNATIEAHISKWCHHRKSISKLSGAEAHPRGYPQECSSFGTPISRHITHYHIYTGQHPP